jgi:hypothetical protein
MKFIEILLKNSQIKEGKLYGPSKKASESPETGVLIQNPAAYHVIKDCATLAHKYLPHYVFGHYANPFEVLKGKFAKADIIEFVNSANSDIVYHQLLTLILDKIRKTTNLLDKHTEPQTASFNLAQVSTTDPYGEYESYTAPAQPSKQYDTVSLICEVFGVTS